VTQDLGWVGLLRHGQSKGNVASAEAERAGNEVIDLRERDADVALTELGAEQATAAGRWVAERPPDLVVASSYRRALDTARIALSEAGATDLLTVDERLRDRELGILDLLTTHGVRARYPEEQTRRRRQGKFYYRPPGGESWADVVLRLRSFLDELGRRRPGANVLLVAHEMTLFALRYILEGIPEPDLLRAAAETSVANASVTLWDRDETGRYRMALAHDTGHLHRDNTPPTMDDDAETRLP
jgi:broad specificity phosphatase PhoE